MVNLRNIDTKHQESETISINSIYLSFSTRLIQFEKNEHCSLTLITAGSPSSAT